VGRNIGKARWKHRVLIIALSLVSVAFMPNQAIPAAPSGEVFLWSKTVRASVDEVMEAVRTGTGANNFPISLVRDYGKTFSKRLKEVGKGEFRFVGYMIVEACNVMLAIDIINIDPRMGAFMPCRLFLYQSKTGEEITVSTVNPNFMAKVLNQPKLLPALAPLRKVMGDVFKELEYLQ